MEAYNFNILEKKLYLYNIHIILFKNLSNILLSFVNKL